MYYPTSTRIEFLNFLENLLFTLWVAAKKLSDTQ